MPIIKRVKTNYPGVYYIEGISKATGKPEKIYYIRYRLNGKAIDEKAGRQYQNDMTPAKAARIRSQRIDGNQLPNKKQREAQNALKQAEKKKWSLNRLWQEYKTRNPDLKGLIQDENRFKNYILPLFGDKEPKEIMQSDIDNLRITLLKKRKPGTVKNVLELLRRILMFGVKKQLCNGIGFTIQMPKADNLRTEDLTPEQLRSLLEAIDQDSNMHVANIMKLALFTGMRRGEIFRLKWEDIDFQRGFILIRNPKGGISQNIPLNDETRKVLEKHHKTKSPYVFPGRKGNQRTDIKKSLNRIKKRAGLPPDFRPLHGLRHVYASMLASSGQVDMYTLQKLLTHKSPAMTQRYAHLRDETLRRASNLTGKLINQALSDNKNKAT